MSLTTGFFPLRIASVTPETDDAIAITLDVPPPLQNRFAWHPGQYLTLRTTLDGQDVRRSYSICSGIDDPYLRVGIKRVEGGRFSGWAHAQMRAGATIDAMPPAGRFTVALEPAASRNYLGVAAGSGITPVLSILKSVLTREPGSRFVLLYGSRNTAGILFRDDLEQLKDRFMGRLSIVHVLSREQQDIPVLNGRLDAAKLAALLPGLFPRTLPDLALLCGPEGMIQGVSAGLVAAGMDPAQMRSERFATATQPIRPPPTARPSAAPFATATVVADGVSTAVPMNEGETLLDAALRAGLDLPYSCRGGMCSTCRARVTEGAVSMDVNYGLEPWETAAGFVLTCQARPTTARVGVDYDQV
jgi:ring-1,2-phenylacetyl-CoA epoxidase subunit PaaE